MNAIKSIIPLFFICLSIVAGAQEKEQTVFVMKTGTKYHLSSCRYVTHDSTSMKLSKAEKNGYTPCSVCKPTGAKIDAAPVESATSHTVLKPGSSRQCSGMTKKGTRCQRVTTNSNGRCYQH